MGKFILIAALIIYIIMLLTHLNPKLELVEGYKNRYLIFYYTTKDNNGNLQRKSVTLAVFNKKNV